MDAAHVEDLIWEALNPWLATDSPDTIAAVRKVSVEIASAATEFAREAVYESHLEN